MLPRLKSACKAGAFADSLHPQKTRLVFVFQFTRLNFFLRLQYEPLMVAGAGNAPDEEFLPRGYEPRDFDF